MNWVRILIALTAGVQSSLAQPGVVIRSNTRLVEVQVIAWDRQGKPVADLRREDFHIFDERKERPLASFAVERKPSAGDVPDFAGRQASEVPGEGTGYSAILLDWLNGGFADRLRANDAVRKALRDFQARQRVAIFVLGMEPPNSAHPLRMICDFMDRSIDISDVIKDPMVLPNPDIGDTPGKFDARSGSGGRPASVEEQLFDWRNRIQDTLRALSELAGRMAGLPGKKSLIWLTNGFPVSIDGSVVPGAKAAEELYASEVDRLLGTFNRLNITVHTVNSKGLSATGRSYGATLREFSDRTGGTMFSDRNDLNTGVQTALEDMQAGYTLGFLVPEDAAPGVHRILIRTTKSSVKLRFRESYELIQ
jgi:VWFA-related protein